MVCMSERYQFYIKAENFPLNKEKYKVPEFIISNENLVSARKVLSKIKADNFIGSKEKQKACQSCQTKNKPPYWKYHILIN